MFHGFRDRVRGTWGAIIVVVIMGTTTIMAMVITTTQMAAMVEPTSAAVNIGMNLALVIRSSHLDMAWVAMEE